MIRKRVIWLAVAAGLIIAFMQYRPVLYSVSAANYGSYGVILKSFPTKFDGLVNLPPGIPGVRDEILIKGPFKGYSRTVPGEIEVVWQLAKLTDCRRTFSSKSLIKGDDDRRVYLRKSGCTFTPIPGQVFRRNVEFDEIMDSEIGRRAGRKVTPWWPFDNSRYGLIIAFEFRDEELQVKARSFETNPWK